MTRTALIVSGLALATMAGGLVGVRSAPSSHSDRAAAEAAFESLKALEGTWVQADELGAPSDEIGSIYHVTAGGAALAETMFPGTEHEMLTVYYVKDGALCMTHYCMLGNRPELVAAGPTSQAMSFECSEDGCCGDEMHMHAATITIVDATHITTVWGGNKEEDGHEAVTFHLVRQESHDGPTR